MGIFDKLWSTIRKTTSEPTPPPEAPAPVVPAAPVVARAPARPAPVKPAAPAPAVAPAPAPAPASTPAEAQAEALADADADLVDPGEEPGGGMPAVDRRHHPRTNARKGTKVLVIDDSTTIVFAFKKILRSVGFQTFEALDAEAGLAMAREEKPELIFLDIVLPGMNGFAALRQIRRDAALRDIPVIMISSNEQATEQFFGSKIGADDFMKKPFGRLEVFARIERLLDANLVPHRVNVVPSRIEAASAAVAAAAAAAPAAVSALATAQLEAEAARAAARLSADEANALRARLAALEGGAGKELR